MKFNQKGQSALEYLMTYGWALVVIVVVVAALVLLVGNPAQAADTCSGPGSGLNITNQELTATGWSLKASNISARTLDTFVVTPTATTPTPTLEAVYGMTPISLVPGGIGDVAPSTAGAFVAGRYRTDFTITYADGDFDRTVTFSCNGNA